MAVASKCGQDRAFVLGESQQAIVTKGSDEHDGGWLVKLPKPNIQQLQLMIVVIMVSDC